jgi:hypothetical protein
MGRRIDLRTLVRPGFSVCAVTEDVERLELVLRPTCRSCRCPDCDAVSASVHSRYFRNWTTSQLRGGAYA